MSRIKGQDTSVEIKVRKYLFSKGFRYRKNVKDLSGKPDIVLPKYHSVIFIHGCFWHRHQGCSRATTPKSSVDYWQKKFERNVLNDSIHKKKLEQSGWHVFVIWECDINKRFEETMRQLINDLTQLDNDKENRLN